MKLDIMIINTRHFTSKKNGKVYNSVDFLLYNNDGLIDNEKFNGYITNTSFVNANCVGKVKPLEICKGEFESYTKGLQSELRLVALDLKNGTHIDLA